MIEPAAVPVVVYAAEPDVRYEFSEGVRRTFGRDPDCDIVIFSALNGADLSRVAGCIWCMEGELWIRNLSQRHDLHLRVLGFPPEPPLPPRGSDEYGRGPARALPGPFCVITAPGGCELLVRQSLGKRRDLQVPGSDDLETMRAPAVPADLTDVAAALCAPMIAGGSLPASYREIDARAGIGSLKRTRNLVGRLCALYSDEIPALAQRIEGRRRAELAELEAHGRRKLVSGVWVFEAAVQAAQDSDAERLRALALPDYFEVAHLLVRRRLVTRREVEALDQAMQRATGRR